MSLVICIFSLLTNTFYSILEWYWTCENTFIISLSSYGSTRQSLTVRITWFSDSSTSVTANDLIQSDLFHTNLLILNLIKFSFVYQFLVLCGKVAKLTIYTNANLHSHPHRWEFSPGYIVLVILNRDTIVFSW